VITERHRDVNILKNLARGDAQDAVTGFDQVVTFAAAVPAAQMIDEAETGAELPGFD
jgi:hypothetical protein